MAHTQALVLSCELTDSPALPFFAFFSLLVVLVVLLRFTAFLVGGEPASANFMNNANESSTLAFRCW